MCVEHETVAIPRKKVKAKARGESKDKAEKSWEKMKENFVLWASLYFLSFHKCCLEAAKMNEKPNASLYYMNNIEYSGVWCFSVTRSSHAAPQQTRKVCCNVNTSIEHWMTVYQFSIFGETDFLLFFLYRIYLFLLCFVLHRVCIIFFSLYRYVHSEDGRMYDSTACCFFFLFHCGSSLFRTHFIFEESCVTVEHDRR